MQQLQATVVQKQRVLAGRWREAPLAQTDERDGAESELPQRDDIEHVHAAQAEGAGAAGEDVAIAEAF